MGKYTVTIENIRRLIKMSRDELDILKLKTREEAKILEVRKAKLQELLEKEAAEEWIIE